MEPRLPHPVKAVIVGRGLRQKDVAAAVGVNAHSFGRIVNGRAEAWPSLRQRLSDYLDLPDHELWRDPEVVR